MSQSIEVQMLSALEIFHYSSRFQNHLFVLNLQDGVDIGNIITDLRVLNRAQIQVIVVLSAHSNLPKLLQRLNNQGCPLVFHSFDPSTKFNDSIIAPIKTELSKGNIPVLGLSEIASAGDPINPSDRFTMNLASCLTVDKVFFLSSQPGLLIDNQFVSHTTPQEVTNNLGQSREINIGFEQLSFYIEHNKENGFDIVLLEGNSGCLFEEIFSHRGKGTLITSDYPNIIRSGKTSDIMDISLLMKPYVDTETILPISEENLSTNINDYYVYTVNNSIVAAAMLKDYGDASELAKFCTLPRYQGKGRARELAEKMIEQANSKKKQYIFSLTIEPKMVEFFISLGFEECDRSSLPKKWKSQYDMKRPSAAFIKVLNTLST